MHCPSRSDSKTEPPEDMEDTAVRTQALQSSGKSLKSQSQRSMLNASLTRPVSTPTPQQEVMRDEGLVQLPTGRIAYPTGNCQRTGVIIMRLTVPVVPLSSRGSKLSRMDKAKLMQAGFSEITGTVCVFVASDTQVQIITERSHWRYLQPYPIRSI